MIRFFLVLSFGNLFLWGTLGSIFSQNHSEKDYENLDQAQDLFDRGLPYLNAGKNDSATYCFAASLNLNHKAKNRDGVLSAGIYLAIALKNQGRLTELLEHEHALESYLNESDSLFTQVKLSLGAAHFAEGNYRAALRYLLKSQHSFEDQNSNNFALLLQIHRNQAQVYRRLGHPHLALSFYQRIWNLVEEKKVVLPPQAIGTLHLRTAKAYAKTYQSEHAQKHLEQALFVLKRGDFTQEEVNKSQIYSQLGEVYELLGNYDEASALFKKAIEPLKESDETYAPTLFRMAKLAFLDKRYQHARDSLNLCSRLFEVSENGDNDYLAEVYFLLGETYRISASHTEDQIPFSQITDANRTALEHYQKVFSLWPGNPESNAIFKIPKLDMLPKTKLAHDLLWAYAQALNTPEAFAGEDPVAQRKSCLSAYQKAMELGDLIRKHDEVEEIELMPLDSLGKRYEAAVQVALSLYENEGDERYAGIAFQFQQQKKSEENRELFWNYYRRHSFAWSLDEQTERRDFLVRLKENMDKISSANEKDEKKLTLGVISKIRERYHSFMSSFRYAHPAYFHLKDKKDYTDISEIRAELKPGEVLLSFFQGEDYIYLFSLSKETLQVDQVKTPSLLKDLEGFLAQISSAKSRVEDYTNRASFLYKTLFAPVIPDTLTSLIVVPDGILHFLPAEVLITSSSQGKGFSQLDYLIQKYPIRYLTHSADLVPEYQRRFSGKNQSRYAAFLPTYYDNDLAEWMDSMHMSIDEKEIVNLPQADDLSVQENELLRRVELMKGDIFTGKKMTKHKYGRYAPRYYSIDAAGFAFSSDHHPVYSGLTFANHIEGENFFPTHEIMQNLYPNDLITLSNHSNLGKKIHGQGIKSLLNSLRLAKSQNITLSLWQVAGSSNQQLLSEFYKNLYSGFGKAQSLRDAKLTYLSDADNDPHPYYWASMVLYGDNIELKGEERPLWSYGALFFALFMVLLILFGFRRKNRKR